MRIAVRVLRQIPGGWQTIAAYTETLRMPLDEFRQRQMFGRQNERVPELDFDGYEIYALKGAHYESTHIGFAQVLP